MSAGHYIEKIETENTGGGCMCDYVHLKDGTILIISEDCVGLYPNFDAYENHEDTQILERPL